MLRKAQVEQDGGRDSGLQLKLGRSHGEDDILQNQVNRESCQNLGKEVWVTQPQTVWGKSIQTKGSELQDLKGRGPW